MPGCCVPNCKNRTEYNVRMFALPVGARNAERRAQWIKNINREYLPGNPCVCEVHFEENQFENKRADGKKFLKNSAVPTLFTNTPSVRRSTRTKKSTINIVESDEETLEYLRCRTCLSIFNKEKGVLLSAVKYERKVKEILLLCVPQLINSDIKETDCICNRCCQFLISFILFFESCLNAEKKIKNGEISLNVDPDDTIKQESDSEDQVKIPKKRGRKRKNPIIDVGDKNNIEVVEEIEIPVKIPKKRGRKPKNSTVIISEESANEIERDKQEVEEVIDIKIVDSDHKEDKNKVDEATENLSNSVIIDHDYLNEKEEIVDKKYECTVCHIEYKQAKAMYRHLTTEHKLQEIEQLLCDICDIKFARIKDALKHRFIHGFPCNLCKKIFTDLEELNAHKNNHPESYCCLQCGEMFKSKEIVLQHPILHDLMLKVKNAFIKRKTKPKEVHCEHCTETFNGNIALKEHIKNKHKALLNFVRCAVCLAEFSDLVTMKTHFKNEHRNESGGEVETVTRNDPNRKTYPRKSIDTGKTFECPFCSEKKSSKQLLVLHMEGHTDSRNFICKHCGLKFSEESFKNAHELTHDSKNKFPCRICWKTFTDNETLEQHQLEHENSDNKVNCCLCDISFPEQKLLENHIFDNHLKKVDTDSSEKNVTVVKICWEDNDNQVECINDEENGLTEVEEYIVENLEGSDGNENESIVIITRN